MPSGEALTADLAVIGAGPAGMAAAARAAEMGLDTVVLDLMPAAGGQVYRLPIDARPGTIDDPDGRAWRERLAASGARFLSRHRVWNVAEGYRVDALGPDGPTTIAAGALVVASGTTERLMPFPGWTTPGVIGLAAATILMKADGVAPGERLIVAGSGPLLALVAAKALAMGTDVKAVVDLASQADWLQTLPMTLRRPDLLARGVGWTAQVRRRGVPWLTGQRIASAQSVDGVLRVRIGPVDRMGRSSGPARTLPEADMLAVGHGLTPATEITRLLRCQHRYAPDLGGWVPVTDATFATSRTGVYAVGDGAGVCGAAAAPLSGEIAAMATAIAAGIGDPITVQRDLKQLKRRWWQAAAFGRAMTALSPPRPGLLDELDPDTLVCRCEDVALGEVDAAIAAGAHEVNQLKSWTRCGMGPCQGRMCGEAVAERIAGKVGGRENAGLWTGRAPLRPVPLDVLMGDYRYADIGIPEAAPL